jgi:predicted MPP superfamily phosphohydrolase
MTGDVDGELEQRLGRRYARQRLGIESDHETQVFRRHRHLFHIENWYSIHGLIRATLRLTGLYGRGRRNAERVEVRRNEVRSPLLPQAFDGFTILHLSDLHLDLNPGAMQRVSELLPGLAYDLCVLTGDYRGKTFGPIDATLAAMVRLREHIAGPIYGVLGNHDTVRLVPGLEAMGIRMLLNEHVAIVRGDQRIHLAGIDDAHYFWVDNIEKAAAGIPHEEFSILLSHTPEIYRQAAHADFDLLLGGHTHGGQICLPGGIALTLDSDLPRRFGAGAWRYRAMAGYTSVGCGSSIVPVRFNCPPEITLHRLARAAAQ